ncbi:5-formyltetrahydrofolate cyclo-ligase [Myxococcota bacterium]|nr:5-formyltetrahydrofolate cyclo-ligase [Myxococcota bacterium]
MGSRVGDHLFQAEVFKTAQSVALYAAQGGEPDLHGFYESARQAGKALFLPRCGPVGRLGFFRVEQWSDLEPGRFGLLEPRGECSEKAVEAIDLLLVPALAVDDRGRRLGRGGGWYDRSLPAGDAKGGTRLAVIHGFQRFHGVLPSDEKDQPVAGYVTEEGLFWCGDS